MKSRHTTSNQMSYKSTTTWSTVLVLSTLAASIALTSCGKKDAAAGGAGAGGAAPLPEVTVVVAQRQPVTQYVELAGRTAAYQLSPVIPQVGGIIQKRLFTEGSIVKAGEPLYQIDPAILRASFEAAQALVQKNKTNLATLQITSKRYKDLIASNAVSKLDYDNAVQAAASAEADLAQSQASLRSAQINLEYTTVRSPITGQSGVSNVTAGALVTANQTTPLVTVQQMDPMYVDISQSSADMLKLRQQIQSGSLRKPDSATISLTLEDGSPYPIKGRLEFSNASVDPASGSVILRALVPNPNGLLLPGMYVKAKLNQGVANDAFLIPQPAVSHTPKGEASVIVVAPDGTVSPRIVQTSVTQGDKWIVTGGLQDGDRLVIEGSQKIRPGVTKVKATIAAPEGADANASNAPVNGSAKPAAAQPAKPTASAHS
ncbi:efflux RND transporter periplasmic adaptor subunit [Aquirhabdus sp.]|uniref:efflux RND transporter periplasmic adaptor subunit n=1 Tax=Aquirhabdus sp. TaxID=2824160 RepID=UPI00396C2F53